MLACGPFFSTMGLGVSLFTLLVVKPATYFAFIQAFRYRVSRDVPMSFRRAVWLTVTRTLVGAALVAGAAAIAGLLLQFLDPTFRVVAMWAALAGERLGLWLCLGLYAGLRGRRLVGWTVSGVGIDLAYDVAAGVSLADQWLIHAGILGAVLLFIAALHKIGRRASLRERFAVGVRCVRCAYDLTGNVSGICPECGTPTARSAPTARAA